MNNSNIKQAIEEVDFIRDTLSKFVKGDEELLPTELNEMYNSACVALNALRNLN